MLMISEILAAEAAPHDLPHNVTFLPLPSQFLHQVVNMGNVLELLHLKKTIPNFLEIFFDVDVVGRKASSTLSSNYSLFTEMS